MANPFDQFDSQANPFDQFDAKRAPERTATQESLRQIGLTARAGINGVGNFVGLFSDPVGGLINKGLGAYDSTRSPSMAELVTGKQRGSRMITAGGLANNLSDAIGLPQPENAGERVSQDIAGAMVGGGGTIGAGKFLINSSAPIAQNIGRMLAAGPGVQTVSNAVSAGAAGITRENGGGAGAQTAAALAGAVVPSVSLAAASEGLRRTMRGGEVGRQRVADNIKRFDDAAGISPSVGQATEARLPRAIESTLSRTPGGAGVMVKDAQEKADKVAASVRGMADNLSPGASPITAGESITKGVNGFKEGFKKLQERLYDKLDTHLPPVTPIQVGKTQAALNDLNADIPGAPNLSEWFKNSRIKGIDRALQDDLAQAAQSGALPYEAIKKLRTLVGRELADNSLVADVPRSKWTALYAALSDDLGEAAIAAGPQAQQAWRQANSFSASQLKRLEELQSIVGRDAPEKVFQAAMSGSKEGDTIIKRVISAIPKDNRADVAAAVLQRMGNANPSVQNAAGDVFSTETFLTNISKLSPEAQNTLFGRLKGPETQNKLAQLANVASNMRDGSKVFANPSGTQQAISSQATGLATLGALATGNPGLAAVGIGAPIGANILARKMTDPNFVNWLARRTEISPAVTASGFNALTRPRD